MKRLLAFVVCVGLTTLAQAPVALVNGEPITREELESASRLNQIIFTLYYQYARFAQSLLTTPEGEAFLARYQRDVLEDLILRKVQVQEARARGVIPDAARVEEIIDQTLELIKAYYGLTDEELAAELANEGLTLEEFRAELRPQAEEKALLESLKQAVIGEIEVSEEEITSYYEQHPDQFLDPSGNVLPLVEVREEIFSVLLSEKQDRAWEEWLKAARDRATVEINL